MRGLLFALSLVVSLVGSSCSTLRLAGTVAVKGSVPHTALVLEAADGREYLLVGPLAEQIGRQYQGRTIRLRGRILRGSPAQGMPTELEAIRILEVLGP